MLADQTEDFPSTSTTRWKIASTTPHPPLSPSQGERIKVRGCKSFSFCVPKKPINKARQTVAKFRFRIVTKKFPRFGNVGARQWHVTWLFRQAIDLRFLAERVLNSGNQILQLNRFALAQVKNIEHWSVI